MAYMELWKHRKKTFEHPGVKRKQGCTEQTVGKRSESNEWDGLNRRQHCEATQISGRWQHFTTGRPESAEGRGILSRTTQCDTNTMSEISSSPKCSYSTMQNTGEWKKSRSDKKESSSPKLCISPLATSLPSFSKCWGFQAEEIMSQSYLSWGSSNAVRIGKRKSCAHPSVMIGYQNPSGVREWIREGRTWSREYSKRQEAPTCPSTRSINRGFSSEEQIYFIYFPTPNSQITKSKPTEGTFRYSYLRILFYAITWNIAPLSSFTFGSESQVSRL